MSVPFGYALALYNELSKRAKPGVKSFEERVWKTGVELFTGSRVEVFRSLSISQTYYTPIYSALEECGCIELLERGRAGQPSVMALYHPPLEDEFTQRYKENLTKTRAPSIIEQRVTNLEGRLGQIDLSSVLVSFEQRLTALEAQLLAKRKAAKSGKETK